MAGGGARHGHKWWTMKWLRRTWPIAAAVGLLATAASAHAQRVTVCAHGCAYREPAAAVAAARDGDLVSLGPGSYTGGFTIDKNVTVAGAGHALTTIRGGGPVITIGVFKATTEPVVTLRGLTITGGLTRASEGSDYLALGGGLWIPPSAHWGVGATVTVADSDITANTVAPRASIDAGAGVPCSDTSDCRFAQAGGGGIDSWGDLTVDHSLVSDNAATGPVTSDADGAGIYGQQGTLTIDSSTVAGNHSTAEPPDGRFAEGAGIMFDTTFSPGKCPSAGRCRVVIRHSDVSDNRSSLATSLPAFAKGQLIATGVNAGGIHIGDDIPVALLDSDIVDNTATSDNPTGEATAIDAAMIVGDSPLTMRNALISGNETSSTVATSADIGPGGATLELDGPGMLTRVTLLDNLSTETSSSGPAGVTGALAVFNFSGDPRLVIVRRSVITGNVAEADSSTGTATAQGGGVFNNSLLTMKGVLVARNLARADSPRGVAQGGGIWNGVDLSGPPVRLTLQHSAVVDNALVAPAGSKRQGGGLYTTSPVTLERTLIAGNQPDQCAGCSTPHNAMAPDLAHRAATMHLRAPDGLATAARRAARRRSS